MAHLDSKDILHLDTTSEVSLTFSCMARCEQTADTGEMHEVHKGFLMIISALPIRRLVPT